MHSTSATSAETPTMSGGDAMDLGIGQVRGFLTLAQQAWRIKNNLCMYYGNANHYAGNCSKANRKTQLRGMTIPENGHSMPPSVSALTTESAENL